MPDDMQSGEGKVLRVEISHLDKRFSEMRGDMKTSLAKIQGSIERQADLCAACRQDVTEKIARTDERLKIEERRTFWTDMANAALAILAGIIGVGASPP